MGDKTIELYLIQSPSVVGMGPGYNQELLDYYDNSIEIKNIGEFYFRASYAVATRGLIKKLVIGSHGHGLDEGGGLFRIGQDMIMYEESRAGSKNDFTDKLEQLKPFARLLAPNADVHILACKVGKATKLLKSISEIWGGVRVHGYTGNIVTGGYLWSNVEKEGSEIVCMPGVCVTANQLYRGPSR